MMTGTLSIHSFTKPIFKAEAVLQNESAWLQLTWSNDRGGYLCINYHISDPTNISHLQSMAEAINKEAACLNQQPAAPSPIASTPTSSS